MKKQLLANHKGNCTGRGRLTTSPFYSDLVGQAEYLSKEFIGEPTRRVGANQNEEPTPALWLSCLFCQVLYEPSLTTWTTHQTLWPHHAQQIKHLLLKPQWLALYKVLSQPLADKCANSQKLAQANPQTPHRTKKGSYLPSLSTCSVRGGRTTCITFAADNAPSKKLSIIHRIRSWLNQIIPVDTKKHYFASCKLAQRWLPFPHVVARLLGSLAARIRKKDRSG